MKLNSPTIFLFASIIIICSCSTGRKASAGSLGANKHTVTFKTHNNNKLNGAEEAVAACFLSSEKKYLPKYVVINYDSINRKVDSLFSNLNYWNKTKFILSRKRQWLLYANATGTNHLLDMDINITYDTVRTAEVSNRLWDHLWKNSNSTTKELVGANEAHYFTETYHIRKIKYKLRYIDGHSGKTTWSMRCRWSAGLFGSKKRNPLTIIIKKFEKKFPYKLADS